MDKYGHFTVRITYVDGSIDTYGFWNSYRSNVEEFAERKRRYSTTLKVEVIDKEEETARLKRKYNELKEKREKELPCLSCPNRCHEFNASSGSDKAYYEWGLQLDKCKEEKE